MKYKIQKCYIKPNISKSEEKTEVVTVENKYKTNKNGITKTLIEIVTVQTDNLIQNNVINMLNIEAVFFHKDDIFLFYCKGTNKIALYLKILLE